MFESLCVSDVVFIGIITPYASQVRKLRRAIGKENIKIGSVEEFQGQERR